MSKAYPCVYFDNGKCKKFSDEKYTSWCTEGACGDETPSNADRIRAMSDEELADWLARTQIANAVEVLAIAGIHWKREDGLKEEMAKENLEWIKQPAEGCNVSL